MDKVTELIISNILGLVIGLGTSFFSWWILFHWLAPAIEFSPNISKVRRRSDTGDKYRVKFHNGGKRAIIGLEIQARLAVKWETGGNIRAVIVPLSADGDKKVELLRIAAGENRVLNFYLRPVQVFKTGVAYSEDFKRKAIDGTLGIADLLSLGCLAYLQLSLSGSDEFSGAKKVFQSKRYTLSDIRGGYFDGIDVVENQTAEAESQESTVVQAIQE